MKEEFTIYINIKYKSSNRQFLVINGNTGGDFISSGFL